jgi:hypothetical protein
MIVKDFILKQIMDNPEYNDFRIEPIIVNVTKDSVLKDLGSDILILNTEILDIPIYSQLHLNADNNTLITSKIEYENFKSYKYQVFTGNISIELQNYDTFMQYQLEFIKLTPSKRQCEKDKKDNCNQN